MKTKILFGVVIILIIIAGIRVYYINKTYTQTYLMKREDSLNAEKILNTKFEDATRRGIGTELVFAIEDEVSWENLPLTKHFKDKYKKGIDIMPERDEYSTIDTGVLPDYKGGEYIVLYGEHKPNFLDFGNDNSLSTVYYYYCFLNDDKKIDDIKLVKKEVVDTVTGEVIK